MVALVLAILALSASAAPALAAEVHFFSSNFGSPGTGNGQLSLAEHSGLAVNQSSHDVYVADTGNGRVEEFTAAGAFVRTFGSFQHPTFVAIDNSPGLSDGDVYVVDSGDNSVSKFTATGAAVTSWGTAGKLGGFGALAGVAVDTSGNLFVLEENSTVHKYDATGDALTSFEAPRGTLAAGLAVDSEGNLYKADASPEITKFGGSGGNLGEPDLRPDGAALAIDPSNNDLYVLQSGEGGFVDRFAVNCGQGCMPLEEFGSGALSGPQGVAVDAASHTLYVTNAGSSEIAVLTLQSNEIELPTTTIAPPSAVEYSTAHVSGAVNPKGHVAFCRFQYVTEAHFQSEGFSGAQSQSCVNKPGSGSTDVAVGADLSGLEPETTYHVQLIASNAGGSVSSAEPNQTFSTKAVPVTPIVSIDPVATVTVGTAQFTGHINPNAPGPAPQDPVFDVNWHFECTPECGSGEGFGAPIAGDDQSHEVSAEAHELQPGTPYEVRLVAQNAGSTASHAGPVSFLTPAIPPTIVSSSVASANATEATAVATIRPGGAATTYHFEYVTLGHFEAEGFANASATPESSSIGADNEKHDVTATISGLAPRTIYYVRVVARNAAGTVVGGRSPGFFTIPGGPVPACPNEALREENRSLNLSDCRAYEQVSLNDNASVYRPYEAGGVGGGISTASTPFQSSADGNAVAYAGEAPSSGQGEGTGNSGDGEGDQQLATRGETGWKPADISPLGSRAETFYEGFSTDLSRGILVTGSRERLAPEVETDCSVVYSRASDGIYRPLFTAEAAPCHRPVFAGQSADGSHTLFESAAAQAPGAQEAGEELGHGNIYDFSGGQLTLVNVLPGPAPAPDPDATVGSLVNEESLVASGVRLPPANAEDAISADGSKVFWTDLSTGILYVRANGTRAQSAFGPGGECTESAKACTIQVSAGAGQYWNATPDGHYVYYTEAGGLWRFDTDADSRQALAGAGAEVLGVLGVNKTGADGSYVYFVANGVLAANSVDNGAGEEEAEAGQPNLYLIHGDETRFVATLLAGDNHLKGSGLDASPTDARGDWRAVPSVRSAEISADGTHLVFSSGKNLTRFETSTGEPMDQLYVYDAGAAAVSCISCPPSGISPPVPVGMQVDGGQATYLPSPFFSIVRESRAIVANGERVFFESQLQLLPADENQLLDTYEWEAAGAGSCVEGSPFDGGGCLYLLSGGKPGSLSGLLEASESGNDVFFVTHSQLAASDVNEKSDLYDARVDGGFPASVEPIPCEVDACRGPIAVPPTTQTPGSSTFSGAGNQIEKAPKPHKKHHRKKRRHRKAHKRAENHRRGGAK